MAQIKSKQIKLVAEGDLIIGDSGSNGSILSIGAASQIVISNATTGAWGYLGDLRDPTGTVVIDTGTTPSQVNNIVVTGGAAGTGPTFTATGSDTNIDINLTTKGSGEVLVPLSYVVLSSNALTTKQYVDGVATGLDFKNSVIVGTASSSDLSGFTYTAGSDDETAGAAPWTVVTSPVFDGITLADGDRVLIKDAIDAKGNGIFTYDAGSSTFIRADDADNAPGNEVSGGMFTFIETGITQADTGWVASSPDGNATLGTDDIVFTQFSATPGDAAFGIVIGDSGIATADVVSDTISIVGGEAIVTLASDDPESLIIDLDITGLVTVTPALASGDEMVIYDVSTGTHKKITVGDLTGATVMAFKVVLGDTGTATSEVVDTLTIAGGEGIVTIATDDPEVLTIDMDIIGLPTVTPAVASGDSLVIYDDSTSTHVNVTVNQFFDDLDIGIVKYDDVSATGGANEVFAAFFSFTPLTDAAVTVTFNGVVLRDSGWTRSGTTLTLVDAVNGYSTESGDVISARYETAP